MQAELERWATWAAKNPHLAQIQLEWSLAETSFGEFVEDAWPVIDPTPFVPNWHIDAIADHLVALADGSLANRKLMINVPPGMSKSLIVSVLWPAYCWGPLNMPWLRFAATSYRGDLALRDGKRCRDLIASPWYQDRWGDRFKIRRHDDAAGRFSNYQGGYRLGLPFSGIMGEGGDFLLFDDPHNVEQAEKDEVRDNKIRLIRLALPTRVRNWQVGGVVCIMQRLHERDYCGYALEHEDDWDHLCFPARYESDHPFPTRSSLGFRDPRSRDGEILCEARFSEERITKLEIDMGGDYGAAGQLQQRPMPRSGGMFKREKFQVISATEVPAGGRSARGWDLAGSKGKLSANTAGVRIRLYEGRLYIEHAISEKWGPDELAQRIRAQADLDGQKVKQSIPQDPGSSGLFQAHVLAQQLHGYPVDFSPETGDKATRAQPLAGQVSASNVWLVRGPWNDNFVDEAASFPLGRYRDQIDAASRAYRALHGGSRGRVRSGYARGTF